jgi:hypothetical protein
MAIAERKTIILPIVLHECETWTLALREEHRLRVFENRVLRRILGPKRDEVTGEWRCCTVKNFIICTHTQISLGKSRRKRWAGHAARMGEEIKMHKVLVGKPEGKRPLGRPRRRWEDGIRMDLRELGVCGLDSTVSVQGPVAGSCEYGDEPSGSFSTELVIAERLSR